MRFTVVGADGILGSISARFLEAEGYEVYRFPRAAPISDDALGHVLFAAGVTADFRSRPFDTMDGHVGLVTSFLRTANFESLLYFSSTRLYEHADTTRENANISVNPERADDLYALSKLAGEAVCLNAGRKNVRIARLSNVVVPGMARSDTFIGALCREALKGQIVLQSAASSGKDYLWIEDMLQWVRRIATTGTSHMYNVASGSNIEHGTWAKAISTATGCSLQMTESEPKHVFPAILVERLQNEFPRNVRDPLEMMNEILGDR
jgi:nucleoside-diphosphate-sugar epimerase